MNIRMISEGSCDMLMMLRTLEENMHFKIFHNITAFIVFHY